MTRAPILNAATFPWTDDNNAASHSDPSKFAARMAERLRKAQPRPAATVTTIKPKEKTK